MIAVPLTASPSPDPIRKLDLVRDLDHVADLIEMCFPIHLDPDGKTYVNEMRKAARDFRMMGWLAGMSNIDPVNVKSSGFVWEEKGHIIGNLSLIPLQKEGRRVYLIANVAVHPEHRRQGIARKLTQHALDDLAAQKESQVWLQVRDDNPPAMDLYRSLGFKDQAARTTWRIRPRDFIRTQGAEKAEISLRRRVRRDWPLQSGWLVTAYPQAIRWNLPVNFQRFSPDVLQALRNFLEGVTIKHWSVQLDANCQGVISWQKSDTYANNLWLALPEEGESNQLPEDLALVMRKLAKDHPLYIDYPDGRCADLFTEMGFEKFRTLIWMWRRL